MKSVAALIWPRKLRSLRLLEIKELYFIITVPRKESKPIKNYDFVAPELGDMVHMMKRWEQDYVGARVSWMKE